jgi:hypothetical protein
MAVVCDTAGEVADGDATADAAETALADAAADGDRTAASDEGPTVLDSPPPEVEAAVGEIAALAPV